ncbi:hypothetical protein SKAU_G00071350 [Synaphobranchus kaupii]|uniref:Uncharacterized protein n=1 Tax=Synaphobranchus kaupii TaxID=118154 RepID=A0A9Q1G701_SYNKA|nr:hypothetical protein SKAU_G00071350 [Synaphobranchus kaupii]
MAHLSHSTALLYVFTLYAAVAVVSDSGIELKWYLGCYDWKSVGVFDGWYHALDGQTHNPALCAKLCLDEGYDIAALSSDLCHCSNRTELFLESWHKNRTDIDVSEGSLTGRKYSAQCKFCNRGPVSGSEDPPRNTSHMSPSPPCPNRCSRSLCLPYGGKPDIAAVYRALGPYIRNVSLSVRTERVQTDRHFLLEVSGYLASPHWQSIGIQGLSAEDFSLIDILFNWTPGGQSTHNVTASDDGFFTLCPYWILANPGTYHLNVTVSNSISTRSGDLEVTAFQPSPTALEVTVLQSPQDIPSCTPFPVEDTHALQKVFLGDTTRLRAFVATGVSLDFFWLFTDDAHSHHSNADCLPHSECLTSTVNHTFEKEGIHTVTVNVSNIYGWTQKTIHFAVVRRVLSNLTLETRSGYMLAVGQDCSLELEVFTTARQLLSFNITLEPGFTHTHRLADSSPGLRASGHLRLAHTYGPRSCQLNVRLFHRYSTVGFFPVSVTVFTSIAMAHASLLQPLQVFKPIIDLRPALTWSTAIPTGVNSTLVAVSHADRTGSVLLWTISRGNATVMNQTTEDWFLMLSLKDVGQYNVCVRASNPISSASFHTPLLVQDVISELSLLSLSPEYARTGSVVTAQATVAAGSNVTYLWRFDTNRHIVTSSGTATHVFSQPGVYSVNVTAKNGVSQVQSNAIEFIIQEPAGGLTVHIPSTATAKNKNMMSFTAMRGTDLTVSVFVNESLIYSNDSYMTAVEVKLALVFEWEGTSRVMVRAHNHISSINSTTHSLVIQGLYLVTIEQLQPSVVGENIILLAKVNGHLQWNTNGIYTWSLPHDRTVCSGSPVVSFGCDEPAIHPVNVEVTDSAQSITAGALLNVTVLSLAPRLSHPPTTAVGSPVQFSLKNFSPGSRVDVILGDGSKTTVSYSSAENSFSYTYTRAGLYHIRVASDSGEMLSSVINAQDPIEGLYLMGPQHFSLPVGQLVPSLVTWKATISQGSSCIYRWKLSNRRENISFIGSDQFRVEVNEPAQLRVEVTVENEVSRLSANLSTSVLYPIADVSLTAAPAELGQASLVSLTVAPPQDYDLLIDFGDGYRVLSSSGKHAPVRDCSLSPLCSVVFSFPHTYARAGKFHLSATVSNILGAVAEMALAAVEEPINGVLLVLTTPTTIHQYDFVNATASVWTGSDVTFQWDVSLLGHSVHSHTDRNTSTSFLWYQAAVPGTHNVSVMIFSPLYTNPLIKHLSVKVCGPISSIQFQLPSNTDHALLLPQPSGSSATQDLQFSAYTSSMDVTFTLSFGDGSPVLHGKGASHPVYPGAWFSRYHRFTEEGTFIITVTAFNEFYNATEVQCQFYVEKMPANLHLTTSSSRVHKDEVVLFNARLGKGTNVTYTWNMGDQTTYVNRGPVVSHLFLTAAVYNVSVTAQNRVGSVTASTSISVLYRIQPVRIYTDKQAYATDTVITFLAVTQEPGPLEFLWYFGDRPPQRTTSKTTTKRYYIPGSYNVIVNASNGLSSFTSDIYAIVIQREVQPNRLLFDASVLMNTSVNFDCRINRGTNVTYHWNFGDGTNRMGKNSEQHIFHRTGEFTVEVTVSNLVSSASLMGQLFVVHQPCQPPPVKNMGPLKIQMRRYQALRLGVTYEADIQCNISQGLLYSWALYGTGGLQVHLSPVETHQQNIELPNNFLHYGSYTAIAKVQVQGSVVYSNYTVRIEVVPSPPVSLIYGGTNIFISNSNSTILTLDGQRSYDPDYPQNILRFIWKCKPVSIIRSPCFDEYVPTSSSMITFPASSLKPRFDQFQFMLTVQSGDRTSTSEVFITVSPKLNRKVKVFCYQCQGSTVNWYEKFSVEAHCESCGIFPRNIFYTWKLFLVNASSKVIVEVPFCKSMDLSMPSRIFEGPSFVPLPELTLPRETASGTPVLFPEESQPSVGHSRQKRSAKPQGADSAHIHLAESAPDSGPLPAVPGYYSVPLPPYYISEYTASPDDDIITDFPIESDFPPIFESSDPIGRPGVGSGSSSGGDVITVSSDGEGNNLVDPSTLLLTRPEKTLLDLHRELIDPTVFQTLVFTGISSPVITFKPFMLKAKSLYMLEASAADSKQTLLGKTQLFFSTNEIPRGMICQVQPSAGYEIHTDFSIFCTSGKEDLLYEYSFSIGKTPRKILYQGRDFQYYFNLPSGDPYDDYKVTIYTEIRNRFGGGTKPCPVSVKVLPIFQRNTPSVHNAEMELYAYGLRNITKLMQMGSNVEIRNYILLLTDVLNRLSVESAASIGLQTDTRSALISTVCQLTIKDQGTLVDNIYMLKELMSVTEQVSFQSARLVTRHIQAISAHFHAPSVLFTYTLDEWMVNALVTVLSRVIEALLSSSAVGIQLITDGIRTTTHLLLKYVLFNKASEHSVSTSLMELETSRYSSFQNAVDRVGSATFYLPDVFGSHVSGWSSATQGTDPRDPCVISQRMFFKQNPYFWGNAPAQINDVADLTVYNCTTRRAFRVRSLSTPVNIEFQKRDRNESNYSNYSLLRSHMSIHQFNTFPIMLLFRMFERPTPSLYNTQRIYSWEGNTVHISLPPFSLNDAGTGYLALLNADYDRTPWNKYVSNAVNYTLSIESTRCLSWDGVREWNTDGCTPLEGMSSDKVNCSCNHLATFAVAYKGIQSHHEFTDVSQFIGFLNNQMLCSVYGDFPGSLLSCDDSMQDNSPSDKQLYAVTIDTGFRSRPTMTAKVHIVLHGEGGASQTRELDVSHKLLFERNSKHTFILSTPDNLGPIWKVHLWHNNGGPSPSWYLSHLVVMDLTRGGSWFFPGECWLAVAEGDGRVERELTPLTQGLGFTKLLYLKLCEYLEDFHSWASVGYMCVNAVLISLQDDKYTVELGLIDVSTVSLATGVFSTLVVLPVGALVSLLFRLCKAPSNKACSGEQYRARIPQIYSVEAHHDTLLVDDSILEAYLPWHSLQQWAQEKWRMQCQSGVMDWRSPNQVPCSELHMGKQGQGIAWFEDGSSNDNSKPMDKDCKRSRHSLQSGCKAEHSCVLGREEFGSGTVVLPSWCRYVTWALCLSLTLVCIVITVVLGIRFSTTKSLLWIHSLFFSMLCCVFVVQPALILIIAAAVSLRYKERCDFYTGSDETEPVGGPEEHWSHNGGRSSEIYPLCHSHPPQNRYTHFDRVLAARRRARYLRLTRPPTPAELKDSRDRMKKEMLIRKILREAVFYIFMLFLLLFVTYGKSSNSQYQLNQAVRGEFTRNPRSPFHAIKTQEDWWNWSLTTLLDGLYWDTWYNKASTNTKAGAVQGTCILIGEPTLKKVEKKTVCKVPSSFEGLLPECLPAHSPGDRDSGRPESSADLALTGRHRHCGHIACYEGAGPRVSLGQTRSEASVRLQELWGKGWLDRYTQAVIVQFTLYNPPTNLFTSVSLLTEQPSIGGMLHSAFIESIKVYQTAGPLHYTIMACELLFLLFLLLHLYLQICTVSQKGLLAYWRDTRNWLEVTIIIISLLYYICYLNHLILTVEIIDLWQRENFKSFVDLGFISSWEQLTRSLHGFMVFLLLLKCIFLLQTNRAMAPSVTLLKLSLKKLLWPLVAGVILMIAFASLGNLFFLSSSHHFSSLIRSFQTVIAHCLGVSQLKALSTLHQPNKGSIALLYGFFFLSASIIWTALITAILNSLAKTAKKTSSRKYLVTFSEVAAYIQNRLLVFLGRRKEIWRDNHTQRSNFYFDEFENLVDELLFRLNALSNNLHHTLPCKEQGYREQDSPPMSHSEYTCSLASEQAVAHEDRMQEIMGKRTSKTEGMVSKSNPDIYHLLLPFEDKNHLRSNLELEALCHPQQSQHNNHTNLGGSVVTNSPHHTDCPEGDIPESSTALPGIVEASETHNGSPLCSDHYNLAQLGNDLPHVLCGTRCPEKQAVHSGTLERQMSRSATDLLAKNRKLLRRSHTTVIRPLGRLISGGREGAVGQENLETMSTL